jgi:SAM-dependent methyltransferase
MMGVTGTGWDDYWSSIHLDLDAARREERTLRWKAQERLVRERFGSFNGLRVIEIGSGHGTNALLYAERGAQATLLDASPTALKQATDIFRAAGLVTNAIEADALNPPDTLIGAYDLSISFGTCEHFVGESRREVVTTHLRVLREGGLAIIGVPNRWSPIYRLWMKVAKATGRWRFGTEVPFSAHELIQLARTSGGEPLTPMYGSGLGTLVEHGINGTLSKLGIGKRVPVPQTRIPGLDRFAYELTLPVMRQA